MLAALHSGAGKTVVTCALLTVLRRRGMQVRAFKCGPDYIDPMFHSRVLGVPSRNIDLFLQGKAGVRAAFKAADGDIAIVEGAMGFYDGVAGTEIASAWAVAEAADIPVVLVLRPQGAALTLAAQLCGIQQFRPRSHIAGVLLNDCKASLAEYLSPILQRETGLPVLGYLPHCAEAELPSRHLGLWTPEEISNLRERNETLAMRMEESVDIQTLLSLANGAPRDTNLSSVSAVVPRCRIAVARDEAFCFYYEDNLDALRMNGAELVFFSPMRDAALPVEDTWVEDIRNCIFRNCLPTRGCVPNFAWLYCAGCPRWLNVEGSSICNRQCVPRTGAAGKWLAYSQERDFLLEDSGVSDT